MENLHKGDEEELYVREGVTFSLTCQVMAETYHQVTQKNLLDHPDQGQRHLFFSLSVPVFLKESHTVVGDVMFPLCKMYKLILGSEH